MASPRSRRAREAGAPFWLVRKAFPIIRPPAPQSATGLPWGGAPPAARGWTGPRGRPKRDAMGAPPGPWPGSCVCR